MAVYQEILEQIATLSKKEQNLLLQELKNRLDKSLDENDNFINEDLDKSQLIADFKQSLLDAKQGKVFPLEELWEDDEE